MMHLYEAGARPVKLEAQPSLHTSAPSSFNLMQGEALTGNWAARDLA